METEKREWGVVVFTEGDFDRVYLFTTESTARDFASGVRAGAGLYGGDGCATYVLPPDLVELEEQQQRPGEVLAARVTFERAIVGGMTSAKRSLNRSG